MTNILEKQFVVSRRENWEGSEWRPWKWFDARRDARAFVKAKKAASDKYEFCIEPITRGPRS